MYVYSDMCFYKLRKTCKNTNHLQEFPPGKRVDLGFYLLDLVLCLILTSMYHFHN